MIAYLIEAAKEAFVTEEGLRESGQLLENEGVCTVNPIVQFSSPSQMGVVVNERGIGLL